MTARRLAILFCGLCLTGGLPAIAAPAMSAVSGREQVAQLGDPLPPNPASASQIVQGCQIFASEQGLKGKAFSASVDACIDQERPSLGIWRGCLHHGLAKKLHGATLDSYVANCANGSS